MVEIMEMQHKTELDTQLVRGLVLDHGSRHPEMPKRVENAYILTCNVSLEYEKRYCNILSDYHILLIKFFKILKWSQLGVLLQDGRWEREQFVKAERQFIEKRVQVFIDLKKKLCEGTNKSFVVLNEKVCKFMLLQQYLVDCNSVVILQNW